MKHLALLLLLFTGMASAGQPAPADAASVQKRLDFIANIQRFQGMYDSVVAFCGNHVSAKILERSRTDWLAKNQIYLDLRNKELDSVIAMATSNGAAPEDISKIRTWVDDQYESRLHHDRLYKDLVGAADLTIPCSKRLGEMVSESMSLQTLSPESVEYSNSLGDEP